MQLPKSVKILLILVGSAFVFRGSLFAENKVAWPQPRQVGASLDGYWFTTSDDGCFRDDNVALLKNGKTFLYSGGRLPIDAPMRFSNAGGTWIVEYVPAPNVKITNTLSDNGNELFITRSIREENGVITYDATQHTSAFRTCDNPTWKGDFMSIFKAPFELPV
jgi:hypothetical protein